MSYLTNQVVLQGVLINKKVTTGLTKKSKQEFISVELTIRTNENEEHIINMYSNKLTKENEISKIYESLTTISNEYKTAEMVGIESADKVYIKNGEISVNRYIDKNNDLKEHRKLTSKFCERVTNNFNPKAEFVIVGVVESVIPKMNKEEEVEFLKLNLIVPKGYNNLIDKIQVIIREKTFFDYIEENFTKDVVVRVGGLVVNRVEKTIEEQISSGFGQMPKLIEKTTRNSELLATGGDILFGVEDTEFFTKEEIKLGIELFNQSIEELKSTKQEDVPIIPNTFGTQVPPNPYAPPQMPNF